MSSTMKLQWIDENAQERFWNFSDGFQIGRSEHLELRLPESSVSRLHAEVSHDDGDWFVRDLGSRNGTLLNEVMIGNQSVPLHSGDSLQLGSVRVDVQISTLDNSEPAHQTQNAEPNELIETVAHSSREKILKQIVGQAKENLQNENRMMALLRASLHLGNHQSEEELVDAILGEALTVLDAQRSALVVMDEEHEALQLRAVKIAPGCRPGSFSFSRNLAVRCLTEGKSILCPCSQLDSQLNRAPSVLAGEMNSILCVLLRTPRKPLGVLHIDRNSTKDPFTAQDLQLADALAASVSAGLESSQLLRQQQLLFLNSLNTLAQAVELRDPYTAGHAQRVTKYALLLGHEMNLSSQELRWLEIGTPLHDIGKIGIEDAVLRKPGPLTAEEFRIMQSHTVKGDEMLKNLVNLSPILPIVRSHHERWDGTGYPDKLAGEDIPLLARVVAVADTFDAMTTTRPYRQARSFSEAASEIRQGSSTQFDAECAEAFFAVRYVLEEEALSDRRTSSHKATITTTKEFRPMPGNAEPMAAPSTF